MLCAMRASGIFAHNQWGLLDPRPTLDPVLVLRESPHFEGELALTE
jgi:hypothetical protein